MPDVFDSQPKAAPQGDMFDAITPAAPKRDVFDSLGPSVAPIAKHDIFDAVAPSASPSLLPSDARIEASEPTVWQRIRDVFTAGMPRYSSRTASNPKYGQMQIVSPEEAMTPSEQERHPVLTASGEFAGGMTSPENAAILAGTAGLGELPGAAQILPRLVSAGFSAQMIYQAAKRTPAIYDALKSGDYNRAEYLLTKAGLNLGMAGLSAKHAATGRAAVTGKAKAPELAEDQPFEETSPVARAIADEKLPPEVRLTDTTATAQHVQNQETILPGFEQAVTEQKRAAGQRQAEDLTEQINRPPESIESAAGEMERSSPLFRGTEASPQSELFKPATPGAKPKPVAERYPADVITQAEAEMRGAIDLASTLPKAGRYFSEFTEEEHPLAGRYKPREGERPGGVWYGVGSQKENIAGQFPWFADKDINQSRIQKALDKGKGADYERIVGKIADGIMRERESSAKLIQEYAPQLRSLAEQVREIDPEKAGILTDIVEGRSGPGLANLRDYIEEQISDANAAAIFSQAVDEAAGKAGAPSASESTGLVGEAHPAADSPGQEVTPPPTARVVTDEHVPVVSRNEILAQRIQTLVNNSAELAKLGVDPSQIEKPEDVTALLDRVADHVKTNLDDRASSVLTFDLQKQLARELNMSVEDLLSAKSGQAFNAEQAIAARALLHESQNRVLDLAKRAADDPSYMPGFTQSLAAHKSILDVVKGTVAREAGRALGSFRISEEDLPQSRVAEALSKLSPDGQAKAAQLLAKIDPMDKAAVNDFIAQIKPSSPVDKLFEYYRNALLSSPHTPIVKGASEVTMMALEMMKKAVAGGLAKDRYAAEGYYYAKGAFRALQNLRPILTGAFQLEDMPDFERTRQQAIKGTLGRIIRFPSALLSRQTNLMWYLNWSGELEAQAARLAISEGLKGQALHARQEYLATNPTDAMREAADQTALHNTFQSELGKYGTWTTRAPGDALRFLFPFRKTPINLVKASAEFSPWGILKGIAKGDVNAQAAGLVGSALASAIAYAALSGRVTGGGPIDFRKQQTLESTGWQPYSIRVGNKYYSYHRLEPLGLTFGLVADAIHGMRAGDSEEVTQSKADSAASHIMRNASSLPFLYEMSALLQAIDDPSGRRIDNFVDRQIASLIPAGVANVAEGTDRTVRHPSTLTETVESRVPGMTGRVPAALDITGKPLQRPVSGLGGANPFPVTTAKNDPVILELARLGIATEPAPKTVKRPGTSKRVVPWTLTPGESTAIQSQDATLLTDWLGKEITRHSWQVKTPDQKRDAIKERREQIAQTRYTRVSRLRRKVASGE
jgi:hypothetical protein